MDATRRATLAGLGASALAAPSLASAAAAVPRAVKRHPAFRPWKVMMDPDPLPMEAKVVTADGQTAPLWAWLGSGPAVLVLWATWCGPCLSEKPAQAALQRRLTYAKSATRIKCVQAYDPASLADARARLDRMNCKELETARATPEFERAFVKFFGASPIDRNRTSLPSLVLLGPGGLEIGRAQSVLQGHGGQSYWADAITQQFIGSLDKLLLET